jgi:hypothetical protein
VAKSVRLEAFLSKEIPRPFTSLNMIWLQPAHMHNEWSNSLLNRALVFLIAQSLITSSGILTIE